MRKIILVSLIFFSAIITTFLGIALGMHTAANHNIRLINNFGEEKMALPTRLLDINGDLITEFYSDEKREIVSINEIPENMIYAITTREDQTFFKHNGFSVRGFTRAVINIMLNRYVSGGSTLTMQIACQLFEDKRDRSLDRKLREIWLAYQLEREYTKYEILENYLNKMPFGHGVYGVEAASEIFFGHSVRDNNIAESVLIIIQLAKPGLYSPIKDPEHSKWMHRQILDQVIAEGYVSKEDADLYFDQYWNNYDWTLFSDDSAFWNRKDNAPFFSEYIRGELDEMLLGTHDINKDGYTVYTTLNLKYQNIANDILTGALENWNHNYRTTLDRQLSNVNTQYVSMIDLLTLTFNLSDLRIRGAKTKQEAKNIFAKDITPVMQLLGFTFNVEDFNYLSNMSYKKSKISRQQTTVETALVTLENETGYILAMIGGSEFTRTNQYNRAVLGNLQPGSAFKPLYYSAAISARKITPATHLLDAPTAFPNPDGTIYAPQNYRGEWKGDVLVRYALAHSMNVPSLKVLQIIGFDLAIDRASKLLGITDPAEINRIFPRVYPLGLGITTVTPLQLAKAYATFGNGGKEVTPIAIRYIEDRNGAIILNPEEDLRKKQKKSNLEILTPQENYIMISLLKSVVEEGTMSYASVTNHGKRLPMPMCGKTGTPQNWSDAWTCGFSPYYTTVIWAGFDQPGSSLGTNLSGATAVGPYWANYMIAIHEGLPYRDFPKPETGLVEVTICTKSGKLPTEYCNEGVRKEIFLEGTEPHAYCELHQFNSETKSSVVNRVFNQNNVKNTENNNSGKGNTGSSFNLMDDLNLDLDYLNDSVPPVNPEPSADTTNTVQPVSDSSTPVQNPTSNDSQTTGSSVIPSPDAGPQTQQDSADQQQTDIDMTVLD